MPYIILMLFASPMPMRLRIARLFTGGTRDAMMEA
jgi:hypothetical protein